MTVFRRLEIPDVVEVLPPRHGDHRGFFSEVYKQPDFATEGLPTDWIQDNQSLSATPGTVRGLHFQKPPTAQDKLIRVLRGAIWDVAVDIRRGSPTYGRWVAIELSAENFKQLLVPKGFAHGFMTLLPDTEVLYKVNARYSRDDEDAIRWDDADLGIEWPNAGDAVLSDKDKVAPLFADHQPAFTYEVQ